VPHAELIGGEPTGDVLGAPFYLMEAIDGWSPTGRWAAPFDTDRKARGELAFELVGGIALLSKVDWQARGLTGFGRPENFHERQVDRWLSFLEGYRFRELPGLDVASQWLRTHRPASWSPGIMHGDYQFANVMFSHGTPANLAAIIDWEMTTIGDPLLDLAWALLGWDGEDPQTDFYVDLEGMPKRSELLAHYEKISGRSTADIDYYLVLANWKLGVVLEKSYAALVNGNRTDDKIETFGPLVLDLIATAADLAGAHAEGV
jgi:aminoglycoside phosphotransferase (APT) family kinase protein